MIIDFHAHIIEESWLPDRWWNWLESYYNSRDRNPLKSKITIDTIVERLCDVGGKKLLDDMKDSGVDKTVVLPLDWGLHLGEPRTPIEEQHQSISEISKRSGGKIVPFVGIDPRRENAIEWIKFCLEEYEMKGIKLYPASGYSIEDESFHPIFNTAMEYNVPILIHTGISFGPFLSKYCRPEILDHLCAKYPDVTFIAAHLGSGFLEELCWLGYSKPNLYADCSCMQIRARQSYYEFAKDIRFACDLFGGRRILFGTDWPFSQTVMKNREFAEAFVKLKSLDNGNKRCASYEVNQILGDNATVLLNQKGVKVEWKRN